MANHNLADPSRWIMNANHAKHANELKDPFTVN